MGEDATLGDFLDAEEGTPANEREPAETEPVGPDRGGVDTAGVEPARTTYAFTPDGADCVGCGSTVDRRWGQDGDLVCADCKEW